ncbi:FtsK/SpoIIIE domain-containing protein [Aneurinibacillus aneurinilyticus]|uniref:FtsK/SpoIIIE domain-containing protein n=1 Tax=Aneurinibacillus aneurinilyticus TaxID=1391 RepID=UPI002E1E1580|nr:FtsK/SpoIIIE domain-containing protein [Aneurinibacillus aneurinilyticus]MED0673811.1 FtsK/SpoIIIE domain-containing protein [Aneurinibacillus aneurinilyticus]
MDITKTISNILTIEILKKIHDGAHGIILMNLPSFDYKTLIESVNGIKQKSKPLYFFVGFNEIELKVLQEELGDLNQENSIFYTVEDAEKYRHRYDIIVTRIVIVKRSIPKLSSLLWYEQITTNELYRSLCKRARDNFKDTNSSIINIWRVIDTKPIKEIISFEQLATYFFAVSNNLEKITTNITAKIYHLGLLPDSNLLDSPKNEEIRKRLLNNHKVVQRIRYLDASDQKILQSIDHNLDIQEKILAFYKERDTNLLQGLSLASVELVLSSINKNKKRKNGTESSTTVKPSPKASSKVDSIGVNLILEEDEDTITDLISQIDEEYQNWESGKRTCVTVENLVGPKARLEFLPEIYNLLNAFVSINTFGGIITSDESTAQDTLLNITKSKILAFSRDYVSEIREKIESLSEEYPQEGKEVLEAFDAFIKNRSEVVSHATRLTDSPMLKIVENSEIFQKFKVLISSYSLLITLLKDSFSKFSLYSATGTKEIIAQINAIDVIFIKSPEKIHAILTPLNPLYLWKYVELSQRLKEDVQSLDASDKEFLVRSAEEIPNPLITVFVSSFISGDKDEVIAEVGRIGNLPIYSNENYVNQSTDGIDLVKRSIERFSSIYQHSKLGLKVAFINPPDINDVVKLFSEGIRSGGTQGIHIAIFRTKETPFSWRNTENIDEDILNIFSQNENFSLKVHNEIISLDNLVERFSKNKYHIITLFDPSKRSVTEIKSESRLNLKIHPLCIPKIFNYDPITDKLEIVPASTGNIFTEHHELVARLNDRPKGWHNTVVSNLEPVKNQLDDLIHATEWLIIADPNLKNFEVSTIGPEKCIFYSGGHSRELGIYSGNWSKLVDGLDSIVRRIGNYIPKKSCIEKLLREVQLLNEKSILSIISSTSNATFDMNKGKGTIGAAIAAAWYKETYSNTILASLDTDLARNWLKEREDNTVSDLIGIRQIHENEAIIDIIEVKTFKDFSIDDDLENIDGSKEIKGHAVDQVNTINKLIHEIIFDQSKITSVSRRELLRYQVFKILHNSNLNKSEKKRWTSFLNEFFAANLRTISINNVICYVNFNNNDASNLNGTKYLSENEIMVYELNNDLISKFLTQCDFNKEIIAAANQETNINSNVQENTPLPEKADNSSEIDKKNSKYFDSIVDNSSKKITDTHVNFNSSNEGISTNEETLEDSTVQIAGLVSKAPDEELIAFINQKAKAILQAMKDFSIDVQEVNPENALIAARFIRFRVKLRPGEVLSKVLRVRSDIAREIEAINEIFIDNERGTSFIYIDVPRESSDSVSLLEYLPSIEKGVVGNLNVILGQDPSGEMVYLDLAKAPHLLTAGSTGSGKTIFLYSIIVSLISQYNSDELELVVIDPKQTDFIFFEDLPHLRNRRVIIEPETAVEILNDLVINELSYRTNLLRESRNRDLFTYNEKNAENPLKPILVIVDEYADLIAAADLEGQKQEFERNMIRLAQRSRNVGIHLVIATQRPSADIVTSRLKANVPTRISFSLPANQDSRTILDATGAEDLLGKGDMLYSYNGEIRRLQALFISEQELEDYLKSRE